MSVLLPSLTGLQVRFGDASDAPTMLAVHDACREQDHIDPHSVCYTVPNLSPEAYGRLIQSTPPYTAIVVSDGDTPVAHGWMDVWDTEERLYLWRVWVRPEWRGRDIGTTLLHWGEARAREIHGADSRTGLLLANATEGEEDAVTLLRNEGYRLNFVSPEMAFDDFANLVPVPVVPNITLRPLTPAAHRAVARALCEANLAPPNHEDRWPKDVLETRIDAMEPEWLGQVSEGDPTLSRVAWDGDAVAGAYLCRRNGQVGEIAQVAVRAGWRGRGIARALAVWSLHALRDAGCVTARLYTSKGPDEIEPTDGPYAMYRKFGFYPIARHLRFRKPLA